MAVKQAGGRNAPDGSMYVTNTDGAGNLGTVTSAAKAAAAAFSQVAAATSATALIGANAQRLGLTFYNDSTAVLYLLLGGAVTGTVNTTTTYTLQIPAGGYYETPWNFAGAVTGIWSAANGTVKFSEFT